MCRQLHQRFRTRALVAILLSLAPAHIWAAEAAGGRMFKSAKAAADALLAAAAQEEPADLLAVLGPEGKEVVFSGDATADRAARKKFLQEAGEKTVLVPRTKTSVFIEVGADEWPFPIPIVKGPKGWSFDTAAGREELISRRIGRNELRVIAVCETFVTAERDYARIGANGAGPAVHAQKLMSSEGKRDGLYWPTKAGEPESPLGPLAAEAAQEGYEAKASRNGPKPFHGYFFRILTAQGESAPGGAKSYIADGKVTSGFALAAWPTEYRVSRVKTFVVNQTRIVFEKDLGQKTAEIAGTMDKFNPDITWKPAKPAVAAFSSN
jgi:hypothetical protein